MQRPTAWAVVVMLGAAAGLFFASFSTSDFVAHLDRQVHGIHCSFIPGLEATDVSGTTGCHTTLMSPYSSVFRTGMWGGLPVSLPAMGVFAFLLFFAIALPVIGRQRDRRACTFLLLGTALPLLTSIGMGYLSLVTLDAACKLCIGIYVSSAVAFLGAVMMFRGARHPHEDEMHDPRELPRAPLGYGRLALAFGIGVLFVGLPAAVYASAAPDFQRYIGECGELESLPASGMLVPLGPQNRTISVIGVFDPLGPACRGFEQRFGAQNASEEVNRQVLLFPLDDECNWMVDDAIHAGACAISEAILCADEATGLAAEDVIEWAFEEQVAIRTAAEADPASAAASVRTRFPAIAECVGSPQARARLNVGLRYAVDNQMPIITPQVFVNGVRMCDEDTDLGMDFALRRLIDKAIADGPRPVAEANENALVAPAPNNAIQLRPRRDQAGETADDDDAVDGLDTLVDAAEALEQTDAAETGTEAAVEGADATAAEDNPDTPDNPDNPDGSEGDATDAPEASPAGSEEPAANTNPAGMTLPPTSMGSPGMDTPDDRDEDVL